MYNVNQNSKKYGLYAAVTGGIIAVCAIVSIIFIIHKLENADTASLVADIYQNGSLIKSLELDSCGDLTFTVSGDNGCYNIIEVHDGKIGITSASCPDKICVNQGFIDSPLLPVTCLPNNVVITVHKEKNAVNPGDIDMTAY